MKDEIIITFAELYRECTLKALNRTNTVRQAAQLLGVSDRTVKRWKKAYNIRWNDAEQMYYADVRKILAPDRL